jgi:hypothetical protein
MRPSPFNKNSGKPKAAEAGLVPRMPSNLGKKPAAAAAAAAAGKGRKAAVVEDSDSDSEVRL